MRPDSQTQTVCLFVSAEPLNQPGSQTSRRETFSSPFYEWQCRNNNDGGGGTVAQRAANIPPLALRLISLVNGAFHLARAHDDDDDSCPDDDRRCCLPHPDNAASVGGGDGGRRRRRWRARAHALAHESCQKCFDASSK